MADAARDECALNDGVERLFATMGLDRPYKHERAVDDFCDFLRDEPEQVARALARRALESADNKSVAPEVRATLCMVAAQMLTASVPGEADQAATLLRRAFALDPTLALAPHRNPKTSSRDNPSHGPALTAGSKTRDR